MCGSPLNKQLSCPHTSMLKCRFIKISYFNVQVIGANIERVLHYINYILAASYDGLVSDNFYLYLLGIDTIFFSSTVTMYIHETAKCSTFPGD